MKKVFVCYQHEDKVTEEKETIAICKYIRAQGCLPIAPKVYLPRFLTDEESDRGFGRTAKLSLLYACEELWYTGDTITREMTEEICLAMEKKKTVQYIPRHHIEKYYKTEVKNEENS